MVKSWIKAFRLRTLPLAFAGWLMGISLAGNHASLNYSVAGLTLLTAIFLQILSNLANDYGDASSGVDKERKGEERMVSSGKITPEAMKRAIVFFITLSFASGVYLLYQSFQQNWGMALVFLLIGIIGIVAAIKYTVGENPYGYAGFGDLFVFIFFGLVLVFGTYYLQVKQLNWYILLPASSLGLFSVAVLNVNNIRDIESDKAAGKQSIPVRIGKSKAIAYHKMLLVLGIFFSIVYVISNYQGWEGLLFLLVSVLFVTHIRALIHKPSDQLDPYLKQMALSTLLFSLLFSFGQVAGWFF